MINIIVLNHIYDCDYMNISPYGLVVFTTNHKNGIIINVICDYAKI
jgi:hypothetical protein